MYRNAALSNSVLSDRCAKLCGKRVRAFLFSFSTHQSFFLDFSLFSFSFLLLRSYSDVPEFFRRINLFHQVLLKRRKKCFPPPVGCCSLLCSLHRRTLRLAPGLLAAGFTQEVRGGGITRSRNMNNNFKSQFVATPTSTPLAGMTGGIRGGGRGLARRLSSTGGGGFSGGGSADPAHEEDIIAFLRAVCLRPVGGLAARGRGETKGPVAKRSPPGQWSSSSSTSRASARGRAAVPSNGFATGGTADGSILPESIILLTRTGGPRPSQVGLRGGGSAISPRAVAAAFAAAASRAEGRAETEARLLHRLWAERLARGRRRGGSRPAVTSRGGEEEGGRVLLHACAGPGAARAVREALASGRRGELGAVPLALSSEEKEKPLRGEFSHGGREANGHVGDSRPGTGLEGESGGGLGCKIGGCTVVALGSLREQGAFCVVEFDVPSFGGAGEGNGGEGWSVACVEFGRVGIPTANDRAEAAHALNRGGDESFVLNF